MENVVTLGIGFSAADANNEITKLIKKLDALAANQDNANNSLNKFFGNTMPSRFSLAARAVGKVNSSLVHMSRLAKSAASSLEKIPTVIQAINSRPLNPISVSVSNEIQNMGTSIENIAPAVNTVSTAAATVNTELREVAVSGRQAADGVQQVGVNPSGLNTPALHAFNKELGQTKTSAMGVADWLGRAFGATAVLNYLKNATAKAMAFGQELTFIKTLAAEYDTDQIGKGIMNFDSALGDSAKNANALYYAYSSGVRGTETEIVSFTKTMSELSRVIRAEVEPTMDAATTAMNAYNLSAKDGAELSDLFFSIVKWGKAKGEQLASGLGQVISTSATAGVTLNEMGASIASLTKVMQTRNAITYFNNMLSKMIKPTKASRLAAEQLGIELGLTALRAKGFSNVMAEIREKTKDNQEILLQLFPDLRGQRAALQLLNKGWGDFQNQLDNFENKAGAAAEAMDVLRHSTEVQLGALPTTLSKISQQAGSIVTGILTLGGALTPVIADFNSMSDTAQKVLASLTLLTGGIILLKTTMGIIHAIQAKMLAASMAQNSAIVEEAAVRAKLAIAARQQSVQMEHLAIAQLKNQLANGRGSLSMDEIGTIKKEIRERSRLVQLQTAELQVQQSNVRQAVLGANADTLAATAKGKKAGQAAASAGALKIETAAGLKNIAVTEAANAADVKSMAVSKGVAAVQQKDIQTITARLGRLAEMSAARANAISEEYLYAEAIGDTNRMTALSTKLKIADERAEDLRNRHLMAQNGLLIKNNSLKAVNNSLVKEGLAYSATNTIADVARTGVGFTAGFKAMFDTKSFTAGMSGMMMSLKGIGKSFTSLKTIFSGTAAAAGSASVGVSALSKSLTGIGAVFGKTATILTKIFSAASLITTGIVAVTAGMLDMLQSAVRTGDGLEKSILLQPFANWIMGVGKALKNLENMDIHLDKIKVAHSLRQDAQSFLSGLSQSIIDGMMPEMSVPQQLEVLAKRQNKISEALRGYDEATLHQRAQDARDISRKMNALVHDKFSGDVTKAMESAEYKELEKSLTAAEDNYNKYKQGWQNQADAMQEVLRHQKDIFQAQNEAARNIRSMIDEQNFKMMSPEQQIAKTQGYFAASMRSYYDNMLKGNGEIAAEAFESMIGDYNKIRDYYRNRLDNNRKLLDDLDSMRFDNSLKFAKSEQERMRLMREQSQSLMFQSREQRASGDMSGAMASYKQAFSLEEKRLSVIQRMADAERRANDSTMQLIRSMDKFKETTAGAVNAFSVEAVRLQSRTFAAPVKFEPATAKQAQYEQEQIKMEQWAQNVDKIFQKILINDINRSDNELANIDDKWGNLVKKNEETMKHLDSILDSLDSVLRGGITAIISPESVKSY